MNTEQKVALELLLGRPYKFMCLEWDPEYSLVRLRTNVRPVQCYSLAAMAELHQVFSDISASRGLVKQFVMTSDVPGVFNFGGDLALFLVLIRSRERDALRLYGRRCVELVWWLETAAERGVHTTVLVQGDTLGGGLECVLTFHKVIFESSAQGGFPEVLFNLFPGMGGWHFTIRRAGFAIANEMILSGRLYSAEELRVRSLVDIVVPDGQGERAILEAVSSVQPRLRGVLAALHARQFASPITLESLMQTVESWCNVAMELTDRDMRLMERLSRAQLKKAGGVHVDGAMEEIKRLEMDSVWDMERIRRSEGGTGLTEWGAFN